MRATRHPTSRTAGDDAAPERRDVIIRPAPVAMVWQGHGMPHAAIAVPGVSLGVGDVLVAVELATICPSDAAAVLGGASGAVPLVLGHEQVGRVVAVGLDASTNDGTRLVVGMRIVWSRRIGCGECVSCRAGVTSACRNAREYGADRLRRGWELSGGFASHVLVRGGTTILTVPEVVPAAVLAPLSCATALAAAAVEEVTAAVSVDGETVVVAGADLVGLTVTAMLADEGATVVVVEGDATRRSRALDFGARGVAAGSSEFARLLRAGRDGGASDPVRPLGRPVAVVGGWAAVDEAGRDPVGGPLGDVSVVVRLSDAPGSAAAETPVAARGGQRDAAHGGEALTAWSEAVPVVTVKRTDPRHLTLAVDFASNAWFRYPFAAVLSERFPLDRIDDALAAAASASALRIALEPGGR